MNNLNGDHQKLETVVVLPTHVVRTMNVAVRGTTSMTHACAQHPASARITGPRSNASVNLITRNAARSGAAAAIRKGSVCLASRARDYFQNHQITAVAAVTIMISTALPAI